MRPISVEAAATVERVWIAVAALERHITIGDESDAWWPTDRDRSAAMESVSVIVAYTESFVVKSMLSFVSDLGLRSPRLIAEVALAEYTREIEGSWHARKKFSKKWLDSDWDRAEWCERWIAFVDVRNSWVHGLGRLTGKQVRNGAKQRLVNSGISVLDTNVLIDFDIVRLCARDAESVVTEVDAAILRAETALICGEC